MNGRREGADPAAGADRPRTSAEDWARLKALLHEALEREGAARAAFVEAACAGEPARKEALQALLEAHAQAGNFLESEADLDRMAATVLEGSAPALADGARLGPYEVLALLDTGGMGEVYRARDTRLGREVALKVIHPRFSDDPDRLKRFDTEARAASAINDPNVVAVYDVGVENGTPYVVTELLEGETLGKTLRAGRLGLARSLDHGIQIAHGLVAAHDKGVVHRDLKPDNVFVTRQGRLKLLDFGLAKLMQPGPQKASSPAVSASAHSTLMGTPGFIAPERLEGKPVDHRADVFALGAMLYQMLTGRPAFPPTGEGEELRATLTDEPRPFTPADGVPAALARIVTRCLRKRPEERFQSAQDVLSALQAVSPRPAARRRLALGAALAVLLAAALGARAWWPPPPAADPLPIRSLAVLPLADSSGQAREPYFADGMTEALIGEMARTEGLRVISLDSAMAFKDSKETRPAIARRLAVDALVQGFVARKDGRVRIAVELVRGATDESLWKGDFEGDLREIADLQHRVAAGLATELALAARPDDGRAARRPVPVDAYEAYLRGRFYWNTRSAEGAPKAVAEFNRALELDPLYAQAWAGLADTYLTLGDMLYLMPRKDAFARAEAAALRALELDPSLAEAYASLGHLRMHAWQWGAAEQAFRRALALNPGYASAHQWRAYNFSSQRRHGEAIASMDRAQLLDPLSLIINADRAEILYFAGRDGEAIAQCAKALQMDGGFAEARRVCFLARLRAGRHEEALADLERYRRLPDGGPGGSVGYAYAVLGRRREARAVLAELTAASRRLPAYDVAAVYAGLGDADGAFRWLDEAFQVQDAETMILPVDPRLDGLHADPRFAALLARMGLSPP